MTSRTACRPVHVSGLRQVTEAYLTALAASRKRVLATFDRALAAAMTEHVVLIP
jgi:predicted nucleic acid-binding protein